MNEVHPRHFAEDIKVPRNQMILGYDRNRIPKCTKHLKAAPGQLETPFDGLVRVCHTRKGNDRRFPGSLRQRLGEEAWRIFLHKDLGFEIQSARQAQEFMAGSRVAVDAPMLTPSIRINTESKTNVRAVVSCYDGARRIYEEFCLRPRFRPCIFLLLLKRNTQSLESIEGIIGRAAAA